MESTDWQNIVKMSGSESYHWQHLQAQLQAMTFPIPHVESKPSNSTTNGNSSINATGVSHANVILLPDDVEESFVVLEKHIMEPIEPTSFDGDLMSSDFRDESSVFSSVSRSQVESKLCEMLEENIRLKQTIEENNSAMKQQFDKISLWQEEVMIACNDQKQQYSENKELISRLRAENELLRKNIEMKNFSVEELNSSLVEAKSNNSYPVVHTGVENKLKTTEASAISKVSENVDKTAGLLMDNHSSSVIDDPAVIYSSTLSLDSGATMISLRNYELDTQAETMPHIDEKSEVNQQIVPTNQTERLPSCDVDSQTSLKTISSVSTVIESNPVDLPTDDEKSLAHLCKLVEELKVHMLKNNEKSDESHEKEEISKVDKNVATTEEQDNATSTKSSEVDPRDMEIMYLLEINKALKEQVEQLEKMSLSPAELEIGESSASSPDKDFLKQNLDTYNDILRELAQSFSSMYSGFNEERNILKHCSDIIRTCENINSSANNFTTYRTEFEGCRKQLMDQQVKTINNKQTIIKAQKHFQKILSDYNLLLHDLAVIKEENWKVKATAATIEEEYTTKNTKMEKDFECKNKLFDAERLNLDNQWEKFTNESASLTAQYQQLMIETETLSKEKEKLINEQKDLQEEKELCSRREQEYQFEKAKLNNELFLLKRDCEKFMGKLKEMEVVNKNLREENKKMDVEQKSLRESNASYVNELKMYQQQNQTFMGDNVHLQNKCQVLQADLDNFNKELNAAHNVIVNLRKDNTELRMMVDANAAFKLQSEEHEKSLMRMFETEDNYLKQIEMLTSENSRLREENDRIID